MVTHGIKFGTLYTLHVSGVSHHVINVVEQPSVELWHKILGHMSQKGMKILSHLVICLVFHFKTLNSVIIVFMENRHKNHTVKVEMNRILG